MYSREPFKFSFKATFLATFTALHYDKKERPRIDPIELDKLADEAFENLNKSSTSLSDKVLTEKPATDDKVTSVKKRGRPKKVK